MAGHWGAGGSRLERAAEVAGGADAGGAGEQPASSKLARRMGCQIRPDPLNTRPRMPSRTYERMVVAKATLPVEVPTR